jgi:hypothetical protein
MAAAGIFAFRGDCVSILDSDLAEQLTDALTAFDIPQDAVVTTQESSGSPWEPIITNIPHACSGWVDDYSTLERVNSNIELNDRRIYIIASTLADVTPAPGNTVQIAGGTTFYIISVERDPAGACWVLQARV